MSAEVASPGEYWERRARRYARTGAGLRAICSYGMPAFYNQFIDVSQRLALRRWLKKAMDRDALDLGCGVGRWSLRMARRARSVTGVDLSPTMVREARRRAESRRLSAKCRFLVADATHLALGKKFGFILGVTVLQHILEDERWHAAIQAIAEHLADDGLLVLLEAAPSHPETRCDTPVFRARSADAYRAAFAQAGLACRATTGVDPAPFKTLLLPHYQGLSRMLRLSALAAATGASLVFDLPAGRICVSRSWHKVFVLRRIGVQDAGGS
jgi:SAM-dependent methyltransferase